MSTIIIDSENPVDWSLYKNRAVWILRNFSKIYKGVSKSDSSYYRENWECGEDEEEFILFLLQGVGLKLDQIRDEILIEEMQMSKLQADLVIGPYLKDFGEDL